MLVLDIAVTYDHVPAKTFYTHIEILQTNHILPLFSFDIVALR